MEWTDEAIARLKALWAEGHSTAEIGRRMGVSKNAVVGKAHRLHLPARPSPIRRDADSSRPRQPTVRRVTGPTLPPLASVAPPVTVTPSTPVRTPVAKAATKPSFSVVTRPAATSNTTSRYLGRPVACCWPLGEPGAKDFRFCSAESMPGKPYCEEHAQLAYVKIKDKRDDAA